MTKGELNQLEDESGRRGTVRLLDEPPPTIQVGSAVFRRGEPSVIGEVVALDHSRAYGPRRGRLIARVLWKNNTRRLSGNNDTHTTIAVDRLVLATEENIAQALAKEAKRCMARAKPTLKLWREWFGENQATTGEFLSRVPGRTWNTHHWSLGYLAREGYLTPDRTDVGTMMRRYRLSDKAMQVLGERAQNQ